MADALFLELDGEDFSSIRQGFSGPVTSVGTPIILSDLRESMARAKVNHAGIAAGTPVFAKGNPPTFSATHLSVDTVGDIEWPQVPSNTGEFTLAMIAKIKSVDGIYDGIIGNAPGSQTVDGRAVFTLGGSRIGGIVHKFDHQTAPTVAGTQQLLSQIIATGRDGEWSLFVMTGESEVELVLYEPAKSDVNTTALSSGEFVYFNEATTDGNFKTIAFTDADHDLALFAYWDFALTSAQVDTFYDEMKAYYLANGLTIE